jgi:hypothetical protein
MIREPKIPMSPTELPQQRIHEVVGLPASNCELNCLYATDNFLMK